MGMEKQISRRELLKSGAGTAVLSAVGAGGLLSLLANRQAVAAGTILAIVGVTSEVGEHGAKSSEPAHRHTFDAAFILRSINPDNGVIRGDLFGQTRLVISTGHTREDFHIHAIRMRNVMIDDSVLTLVADEHRHQLHVD